MFGGPADAFYGFDGHIPFKDYAAALAAYPNDAAQRFDPVNTDQYSRADTGAAHPSAGGILFATDFRHGSSQSVPAAQARHQRLL